MAVRPCCAPAAGRDPGSKGSRTEHQYSPEPQNGAQRVSSAHVDGMRREVLVDELHCHCSFAYRGRTALRRAGAHVAGGEDAWDACLEESGDSGCFAGEDVTLLVSRDGFGEPLTARSRTEEEE